MHHIEKTLTRFMRKVNDSPHMAVRLHWLGFSSADPSNDPDYLSGVVYMAYERDVITNSELKDLVLALQGLGATSKYFKDLLKKVYTGEI